MGLSRITLTVNGERRELEADPDTPLIYVLRNGLGLTGAKLGCGLEQCGSCAVLVDGEATLTCVRATSEFVDREIVTVEGLTEADGRPGEVQRAFVEAEAAQCGYCTPGLVIAVAGLVGGDSIPDEAGIREALAGHLCRCGSHPRVLAAVRALLP